MRTRHLVSALAGCLVLLGAALESWFQSYGFYQEHYLWPMEKYGILTPLRWQDVIFIVAFWCVTIALFYFSYRLLRYAIHR
jgi:hypothetical protein